MTTIETDIAALTDAVDATYLDDDLHPSVKAHQQDHDRLHRIMRALTTGGVDQDELADLLGDVLEDVFAQQAETNALAAALLPAGAFASTIAPNAHDISADHTLVSGREHLFAIALPRGKTVSTITFRSRTTAAVTPTNQWYTLRDAGYNLLGVTANDGATAWPASTSKPLNLAVPHDVTATAKFFLGIVVTAATPPSLLSIGHSNHGTPLCVEGDVGLTNPASAPAVSTVGGNLGRWAMAWVS